MAEDDVDQEAAGEAAATPIADARRAIAETRDRISARLGALGHRVERKKDELKERIDALQAVRARIRERPWAALAIAAGAGLLLGLRAARNAGAAAAPRAARPARRPIDADPARARRRPRRPPRRR